MILLLDIWRAARARSVPFAGESAGHLTLLACEEVLSAPRAVGLDSVELSAEGAVRVRSARPISAADAERELRELLTLLLDVASSPGAALFRSAARAPTGDLTAFAAELQKALIPFNRDAARRALLRLYRETERAVAAGRLAPAPAAAESAPAPAPAAPVHRVPALAVIEAPLPSPSPVAPVELVARKPVLEVRRVAVPDATEMPELLEQERLAPTVDEPAPESLTRPDTLAARRRSTPPPRPAVDWLEAELALSSFPVTTPRTPRLGSVDAPVAPIAIAALETALLDLTDRVPPVHELEESNQLAFGFEEPHAVTPELDAVTTALPRALPELAAMLDAPRLVPLDPAAIPWLEASSLPPPVASSAALFQPSPPSVELASIPWFEVSPVPPAALAVSALPELVLARVELPPVEPSPIALPPVEPSPVVWMEASPLPIEESPIAWVEASPLPPVEPSPLAWADASLVPPVEPSQFAWTSAPSYAGMPQQKSDVSELLVRFEVAALLSDVELRRELKALAGVDLTPGPSPTLRLR